MPPGTQIAPLLDEAMGRLGQTDRDALVLRFFENKNSAEIGAALRMNEEAARQAREPRGGKIAPFLSPTRRGFDSRSHRRVDFRQFRSSCAGGAGKDCDRRGDYQRRGGFNFNLNPHQRSIENYGMDKNENGDCRPAWSSCSRWERQRWL